MQEIVRRLLITCPICGFLSAVDSRLQLRGWQFDLERPSDAICPVCWDAATSSLPPPIPLQRLPPATIVKFRMKPTEPRLPAACASGLDGHHADRDDAAESDPVPARSCSDPPSMAIRAPAAVRLDPVARLAARPSAFAVGVEER
jgi:hypothetical protein